MDELKRGGNSVSFGKFLDKQLSLARMKRTTLAHLVDATTNQVSEWIVGEAFPNDEQVVRIAWIFNLSSVELMKERDNSKAKWRAREAYSGLINMVRELNPEDAVCLFEKVRRPNSLDLIAFSLNEDAERKMKFCEFGKAVKKRLIDMEQSQAWLIEQVKEKTGLYLDSSYMHRILTGAAKSQKIVRAICEVLNMEV